MKVLLSPLPSTTVLGKLDAELEGRPRVSKGAAARAFVVEFCRARPVLGRVGGSLEIARIGEDTAGGDVAAC